MKNDDNEKNGTPTEEIVLAQKTESSIPSQEFSEQSNPARQKKERKSAFLTTLKVAFSWKTFRILLSHHPYCDVYDKHVFKIGKLHLCRGCTLSYPPAYILPLLYLFWQRAHFFFTNEGFRIDNIWWFTIAFAIFGVTTYFTRKNSIFINDIYKITRGALLGFFFIVILAEPWYFKVSFGILITGLMTYLSLKRGKDMEHTCNECEWGANFEECPGWKDLSQHFQTTNPTPRNAENTQPVESDISIEITEHRDQEK